MIIHAYQGLEPPLNARVRVRCRKRLVYIGSARTSWKGDARCCENCIKGLAPDGVVSDDVPIFAVIERETLVLKLKKRSWWREIGEAPLSDHGKALLRQAVGAYVNKTTPPIIVRGEYIYVYGIDEIIIAGRHLKLAIENFALKLDLAASEGPAALKRHKRKQRRKTKKAPPTDANR